MDEYYLLLTVVGAAVFAMTWMPAFTKLTGISYSIIYVIIGYLLYTFIPNILPVPLPQKHETLTLHLSELVVIISLMGTGLKIDRPFSIKSWSAPLKLVSLAMLISIGACTLMGLTFLNMDLASAVLLGAALAPTDPVLAADVQVGPPNEGSDEPSAKFTLTAEAGMNDGLAFPFTWLAITLASIAAGRNETLMEWFAVDVLYKIFAGVIIGLIIGRGVGYIIFDLSKRFKFLKASEGFLALSLTLLVYGITEMLLGYGFIAVFVTALSLRHYEKGHDYHSDLHSFTDQAERLLVAVLLILFGGAIKSGILGPLDWQMILFTLLFLFLIRPLAGILSLRGEKLHKHELLSVSFFGIRGMGTVFYVAYAFHSIYFNNQDEIWAIVAFTILVSIIIHGLTATRIMKYLTNNFTTK